MARSNVPSSGFPRWRLELPDEQATRRLVWSDGGAILNTAWPTGIELNDGRWLVVWTAYYAPFTPTLQRGYVEDFETLIGQDESVIPATIDTLMSATTTEGIGATLCRKPTDPDVIWLQLSYTNYAYVTFDTDYMEDPGALSPNPGTTLYESTDDGETWQYLSQITAGPNAPAALLFGFWQPGGEMVANPRAGATHGKEEVIVGHVPLVDGNAAIAQLPYSLDGGATWVDYTGGATTHGNTIYMPSYPRNFAWTGTRTNPGQITAPFPQSDGAFGDDDMGITIEPDVVDGWDLDAVGTFTGVVWDGISFTNSSVNGAKNQTLWLRSNGLYFITDDPLPNYTAPNWPLDESGPIWTGGSLTTSATYMVQTMGRRGWVVWGANYHVGWGTGFRGLLDPLYIPYKKWFQRPEETWKWEVNQKVVNEWARRQITRYEVFRRGVELPYTKGFSFSHSAENYFQWESFCNRPDYWANGAPHVPPMSVPYKRWKSWREEEQNYLAMEAWVNRAIAVIA